jgi:hypothetical protein
MGGGTSKPTTTEPPQPPDGPSPASASMAGLGAQAQKQVQPADFVAAQQQPVLESASVSAARRPGAEAEAEARRKRKGPASMPPAGVVVPWVSAEPQRENEVAGEEAEVAAAALAAAEAGWEGYKQALAASKAEQPPPSAGQSSGNPLEALLGGAAELGQQKQLELQEQTELAAALSASQELADALRSRDAEGEEWGDMAAALAESQGEEQLAEQRKEAAQERRLSALAQVPGMQALTAGTGLASCASSCSLHQSREDAVLLAPLLRELFPSYSMIPDPAHTFVAQTEDDLDLLAWDYLWPDLIERIVYGQQTLVLPLNTTRDGNCLLHAASRAMWGVEHFTDRLRNMLFEELASFLSWYSEQMGAAEVEAALQQASEEGIYLSTLHIVALCHVLRRPIVLFDAPSEVRHFGVGVDGVAGIFGPTRLPRQQWVERRPLAVAWASAAHNHFCAVVPTAGHAYPEWPSPRTMQSADVDGSVSGRGGAAVSGESQRSQRASSGEVEVTLTQEDLEWMLDHPLRPPIWIAELIQQLREAQDSQTATQPQRHDSARSQQEEKAACGNGTMAAGNIAATNEKLIVPPLRARRSLVNGSAGAQISAGLPDGAGQAKPVPVQKSGGARPGMPTAGQDSLSDPLQLLPNRLAERLTFQSLTSTLSSPLSRPEGDLDGALRRGASMPVRGASEGSLATSVSSPKEIALLRKKLKAVEVAKKAKE